MSTYRNKLKKAIACLKPLAAGDSKCQEFLKYLQQEILKHPPCVNNQKDSGEQSAADDFLDYLHSKY